MPSIGADQDGASGLPPAADALVPASGRTASSLRDEFSRSAESVLVQTPHETAAREGADAGGMMAPSTLRSILLSSTQPGRLRDWYAAALSPERERTPGADGYDVLNFGGFYLMIDSRGDVGETNPEPGRVILNVDVADARAVATRLADMEVQWVSELEDRNGSLFATAIDPDGNYVQIIQLSEEHRTATENR
jgi:hypothetical protein